MATVGKPGLGPSLEPATRRVSSRHVRGIRHAGVATIAGVQRERTIGRQRGRRSSQSAICKDNLIIVIQDLE